MPINVPHTYCFGFGEITTKWSAIEPAEYQVRFCLLGHAKELRPCCLSIGFLVGVFTRHQDILEFNDLSEVRRENCRIILAAKLIA